MSTPEDEDHPLGRHDNRFFHHEFTKQAIVALARVKTLVIYCGAGVTTDRTGLSWGELIARLLRDEFIEEGIAQQRPDNEVVAARHLKVLSDELSPAQLASILNQVRRSKAGPGNTEFNNLINKLRLQLYQDNGWQSGVLVRNIIRLAVGYLKLGRKVTIVTTNYDEYLENGFAAYCDEVRGERPTTPLPGIMITALRNTKWVKVKNTKGSEQLEIVYLHGRVSNSEAFAGRLVLGECDYYETHDRVVRKLTNLFNDKDSGLLVLGSSGTDAPLLAGLAATKASTNRYAMIPVQSTGMARIDRPDFGPLLEYVSRRGDHFNVKYLLPDFHYQIAQFCEEVLMSVGLASGPGSYLDDRFGMRYGLRLVSWWNRWSRSLYGSDPLAIYDELVRAVNDVRDQLGRFRTREHASDEGERIKVELWVRSNPKDLRRLCLWGTSAGPLLDRSILRSEELRLGSGNASIRAFVEGQPQFVSRDLLVGERFQTVRQKAGPSRWRAFLSVPVRIDYSTEADPQPVGLPLGVITLATMDKVDESDIPHRSTQHMEEMVRMLKSVGQKLLQA